MNHLKNYKLFDAHISTSDFKYVLDLCKDVFMEVIDDFDMEECEFNDLQLLRRGNYYNINPDDPTDSIFFNFLFELTSNYNHDIFISQLKKCISRLESIGYNIESTIASGDVDITGDWALENELHNDQLDGKKIKTNAYTIKIDTKPINENKSDSDSTYDFMVKDLFQEIFDEYGIEKTEYGLDVIYQNGKYVGANDTIINGIYYDIYIGDVTSSKSFKDFYNVHEPDIFIEIFGVGLESKKTTDSIKKNELPPILDRLTNIGFGVSLHKNNYASTDIHVSITYP